MKNCFRKIVLIIGLASFITYLNNPCCRIYHCTTQGFKGIKAGV